MRGRAVAVAMDGMTVGQPKWAPGSFMERLAADERDEVLGAGVTRSVSAGRRLLVEGRSETHVEIIREGYVKVSTEVGGASRLLAVRLPGDIVGEFAAVTSHERSATVTTGEGVVATVIGQQQFLRFLERRPHAAQQLMATVGERLRWANLRRSEFSAFPVHVRLARVLGDIAAACGTETEGGVMIQVPLTQAELATLIGAGPDSVQRASRQLRELGHIGTGYRRIVVRDPAALRALAVDL
jgi:CRP/FNR family cyclic AMP-dependent transcriptional regulator